MGTFPKRRITDEQIQEIVEYRKKGMTLRAIGDKIGFAHETVRYYVDKHLPQDYYHKTKTRHRKPKLRHRTSRDYDFLQYIRPVMKWAKDSTGLKKSEIELMLYLYPKGVFSKDEFYQYHQLIGMFQIKTFQRFIKQGYMKVWRPAKRGLKPLYTLTNKGKVVCDKMHKFLTGEKDIPITYIEKVLAKSEVRIDGYYKRVMLQMIKDKD